MDERVVVGVVVCAVIAGGAAPLSTAADGPSIAVGVDGLPLDPGDVYHTSSDPWVRVSVSAGAPISLVEVRVDGETRHVFEPDAGSIERNVVLDLEAGRHRVQVVARAGAVATYRGTIVRDDGAPVINYSAPFADDATADSPAEPPADELTVNRANVTLNGTISDASAVEYLRVEHGYDYRRAGEDDADRRARDGYLLESPGDSFEQSLYLAPGANEVTVTAEDAVGNVRTHEFTIEVADDAAPSLTVSDVEWVSPTRLHVEGRVRDRVQVQAVWLESGTATDDAREVESADRHPLVFPTTTAPDRDRRVIDVDTTVYHPRNSNYVVLGANDTAGNERTWNYSLSRFLAPNVTVDDRATGYVGGRTVAVGGRITGGQVGNVSVETVDPDTGRIVDIRPVDLAANGSFGVRLAGASGETRVRIRVRDASGAERLRNLTVAEPAPDPATPSGDGTSEDGADADGTPAPAAGGPDGVRLPFVGVVSLPALDVGPSVSLALPLLGSVDVPLVGVGLAALLAAALAVVRRR